MADPVGGVADIVTGAIGIRNALAANDQLGVASNSLTVTSGVLTTAAGAIGTAELFTEVPALLAAAAPPLFLASTVVGAVAGIIVIADLVQQGQAAKDAQDEQFQQLADDGLTKDDWHSQLDALRESNATHPDSYDPVGTF